MRRLRGLLAAGVLAIAAVAASIAIAQALRTSATVEKISVRAQPITSFDNRDPARRRFGALEFRGGLELSSPNRAFGGISALRVAPDGAHFLAVTDNGSWLRGRITYEDGHPAGIADAEMAPILGADGKPLASRSWYDAESLAEDGDTRYVGIERVDQIVKFDYGRDGLLARGEPLALPPQFKNFTYNKSLECLVMVPKEMPLAGTLVVVTERSLDSQGNHRSFLLADGHAGEFSVVRSDDFDVSDCAVLPSADLLLLERRYSPARGVAMRIRRVPLSSLKPGALVDGPILVEADLGYQIDNMEGLAVHRADNGDLVLTLISDDNFSVIQRTLLLQFTLVGQ
ncbi:MAG TPA: esterase-like activity of phytase family protein [Pseudolabrys sp.]|nr:esterase-like activity of phytase family protein [Pseudolabrys sp.]